MQSVVSATGVPTVGQHGLKMKRVWQQNTPGTTMSNIGNRNGVLYLAMHTMHWYPNIGNSYVDQYLAWFIPPKTARYRFYAQCDDNCQLILGNTPLQSSDVTKVFEILSYTTDMFPVSEEQINKQRSEWIQLTKDEPYYFEAGFIEMGGDDSFVMAVEIEGQVDPSHQHGIREVQHLSV